LDTYFNVIGEVKVKDKLTVTNFDFHGYCGGDRYPALKVLLEQTSPSLLKHGWLTENVSTKQIESI
jgi:hypothetical protein